MELALRNIIQVPGNKTLELPPLLVRNIQVLSPDESFNLDSVMLEAEDMLATDDASELVIEQRKFDLALQLAKRYASLVSHWCWGDSVIEWIRQCKTTFESHLELKNLLRPDIWPHSASDITFVELLRDKDVGTPLINLETAIGSRISFRQPPPADCCSNHFLMYLFDRVFPNAFRDWASQTASMPSIFPADRFHFEVIDPDTPIH